MELSLIDWIGCQEEFFFDGAFVSVYYIYKRRKTMNDCDVFWCFERTTLWCVSVCV